MAGMLKVYEHLQTVASYFLFAGKQLLFPAIHRLQKR
jgi:hypothetical protein